MRETAASVCRKDTALYRSSSVVHARTVRNHTRRDICDDLTGELRLRSPTDSARAASDRFPFSATTRADKLHCYASVIQVVPGLACRITAEFVVALTGARPHADTHGERYNESHLRAVANPDNAVRCAHGRVRCVAASSRRLVTS